MKKAQSLLFSNILDQLLVGYDAQVLGATPETVRYKAADLYVRVDRKNGQPIAITIKPFTSKGERDDSRKNYERFECNYQSEKVRNKIPFFKSNGQ